MKITAQHYDITIAIEKDSDDLTLTEMCEVFTYLLKAMGYYFNGKVAISEEE